MPLWYNKRKAFIIRLRRGIYRACEFSSRCSETHMRNYTKILRIYGIITSKGSNERRRFPPPERQTRSLLRTLNHHSASVRPLACGSAAHFTFVKCECGIINAKRLLYASGEEFIACANFPHVVRKCTCAIIPKFFGFMV